MDAHKCKLKECVVCQFKRMDACNFQRMGYV